MMFNMGETTKAEALKAKDNKEPSEEFDHKKLPSPHVIKASLDEYIIGQEHAKRLYRLPYITTIKDKQVGAEECRDRKIQYAYDWTYRKRKNLSG